MVKQSKVLSLADALELAYYEDGDDSDELEAAIELRRLYKVNQELLEVLKSTGVFLHHCWCDVQMNEYSFDKLNLQMEVVDTAIAKATGEPNV